jgi:hypothetical protein
MNCMVGHLQWAPGMDDQGIEARFVAEAESFRFPSASKSAKRPTRPPVNWIPGILSLTLNVPN